MASLTCRGWVCGHSCRRKIGHNRPLVIRSEFLPLARLGWLVYGGQFELRFGSSRPGAVLRPVFRLQSLLESVGSLIRGPAAGTTPNVVVPSRHDHCPMRCRCAFANPPDGGRIDLRTARCSGWESPPARAHWVSLRVRIIVSTDIGAD